MAFLTMRSTSSWLAFFKPFSCICTRRDLLKALTCTTLSETLTAKRIGFFAGPFISNGVW